MVFSLYRYFCLLGMFPKSQTCGMHSSMRQPTLEVELRHKMWKRCQGCRGRKSTSCHKNSYAPVSLNFLLCLVSWPPFHCTAGGSQILPIFSVYMELLIGIDLMIQFMPNSESNWDFLVTLYRLASRRMGWTFVQPEL